MKSSFLAGVARAQGIDSPLLQQASQNRAEQIQQMREKAAATAAVIGKAFGTPDGQAAFEALFVTFFMVDDVPLALMGAEQVALYAERRQGQKDVIIHILNALRIHGGEQPLMTIGGSQ